MYIFYLESLLFWYSTPHKIRGLSYNILHTYHTRLCDDQFVEATHHYEFVLKVVFVIYSLEKKTKKTLISFIYHHFIRIICFISGTRPGALKPSVGDGKKSSWYHLCLNIICWVWNAKHYRNITVVSFHNLLLLTWRAITTFHIAIPIKIFTLLKHWKDFTVFFNKYHGKSSIIPTCLGNIESRSSTVNIYILKKKQVFCDDQFSSLLSSSSSAILRTSWDSWYGWWRW